MDVWSNPGDLVVDPFAGSATVGRACEDLGRRFIGAELKASYFKQAAANLKVAANPLQRSLFEVA